jgi:hypothetical protein
MFTAASTRRRRILRRSSTPPRRLHDSSSKSSHRPVPWSSSGLARARLASCRPSNDSGAGGGSPRWGEVTLPYRPASVLHARDDGTLMMVSDEHPPAPDRDAEQRVPAGGDVARPDREPRRGSSRNTPRGAALEAKTREREDPARWESDARSAAARPSEREDDLAARIGTDAVAAGGGGALTADDVIAILAPLGPVAGVRPLVTPARESRSSVSDGSAQPEAS